MTETSGQYDQLLTKLNNLKRNLIVVQNSVNQNELNDNLNKIVKNSELEVNNIKECINRLKITNKQFNDRMSKLSPTLSTIGPLLDKLEDLSKLDKLLEKFETIKQIHYSLESNVINCRNTKEMEARVVAITHSFNQLVVELKIFSDIHRNNLMKDYLLDVIMYWKHILYEKFEPKFIETFDSIDWPNINNELKPQPNIESINVFVLYFNALFTIDIETKLFSEDNKSRKSKTIILPIDLMLRPLKKRFQYHFMETKSKLNRPEKPEWYLSQTIQWIRQNEEFLIKNIDPLLRAEISSNELIPSKFQLINGLIECVSVKLKSDLPSLVFDDKLFSHIVDEVLIFNKELLNIESNIFDLFPNSNLMSIFSNEPFFSRILSLEKKKSAEFVEFILESKSAWNEICGTESSDELRICESADNFVLMLQSVTNRCSFFTDLSLKYKFVGLELEILDDFRLRLIQLVHNCDQSWPHSQQYFAIINTINYLILVLDEWKNLPLFVEISETYVSNGTVFDEIISLLEHLSNEFITKIKFSFINDLKNKFQNYKSIKWFCLKSTDNCLSSGASELLHSISTNIVLLQKSLSNTLFDTILHEIADQMNRILFEDLILKNTFNELGAKQLHYDLSIGFMSLFRLYMARPQLHFAETIEASKLLTLERGSSLLLKNMLSSEHNITESKRALKEMDISKISPLLALNVLNKRIYLN